MQDQVYRRNEHVGESEKLLTNHRTVLQSSLNHTVALHNTASCSFDCLVLYLHVETPRLLHRVQNLGVVVIEVV